jgi:hypothetical protein
MKKMITSALLCFFAFTLAVSQNANSQTDAKASKALINDFSRSGHVNGMMFNFLLLNDKTIDQLFTGPSKYSIKARTSQGTVFYVTGTPAETMTLNNTFTIVQDGQTLACESVNVLNFAKGVVTKGQKIQGLLQVEKKLDLSHPFVIKGEQDKLEFKLSESAIKQL